MKIAISILFAAAFQTSAWADGDLGFIRQINPSDGVVWDMPVATHRIPPAGMGMEKCGSVFQMWKIRTSTAEDQLLDQKLIGAYLPMAEITITTPDPSSKVPRTRVDQSFVVNIDVSGLLPATDFPLTASTVLLERHLGNHDIGKTPLKLADVISGTPYTLALWSDTVFGRELLCEPVSFHIERTPQAIPGEPNDP